MARLRQKPPSSRTKGQSCTNFQIGPLKWGCSLKRYTHPLVLDAGTNNKVSNHTLSRNAELLNEDNNVISFQADQPFWK